MSEPVIVDAVRTPSGRRNGALSSWHPASLAAHVLRTLADGNDLDPSLVDDVIMGCVGQVGVQGLNIGRNAVLTAGWPESVPATTIDRQCGSSQQALHFAAQGIAAGAYDVAIAAGVEVMSRIPLGSTLVPELGDPFTAEMYGRYQATGLPLQGLAAELIADEYNQSREELDEYGAQSQRRAHRATTEGRFAREIVGVPFVVDGRAEMFTRDEGIRPDTTVEALGQLKPAFKEDGKLTAGSSSQIADGASAVLVMSEERCSQLGLRPRARFREFAVTGTDPVTMLKGPIPVTAKIFERSGLAIEDIDVFEVNEAFASVVLAWAAETGADLERTNVNGGAIALGHPLGASGTKLMATLVNELERSGGRFGMQVMCEGGGLANATIIEALT
jgi:acetyl-CoA acyltransferase